MSDYPRKCFLPGQIRLCTPDCMAFVENSNVLRTTCRILNAIDKLIPAPVRPTPPSPPKVNL